jgi:signal peptidase I
LKISHIKIFRDIYYYSSIDGRKIFRASEGSPFTLDKDEFFVLGDNSPASLDSRLWTEPGLGNGRKYRVGVVPRDYLVGKAFVVFWPGGQIPFKKSPLRLVPYIGGMKIIAGGAY